MLEFALTVARLGTRSFTLRIEARCAGELRLRDRQVLVFARIEDTASIAIPSDLRERMARFQEEET